ILMQRPKAILFVKDPALKSETATEDLSFSQSYQVVPQFKKQISFSFNAYIVSEETVNMLLKNTGETLESLQEKIAETKKPVSFILPGIKAEVSVKVEKDSVTSSNIAGYIEGSDPVLKDECVIYTAHYDHSGIDGSGNVLNGANDNASGAIGLLNVAKAFSSLEEKPLRSIVFLWTTGEEEGLHGSSYYVDHPLFPLEKTVVNINFDMIGRSRMATDVGASLTGEMDITGADTIKIVSARESTGFLNKVMESCIDNGLYPIDEGKGSHFSGSDHYPFFRKGIPAVFFFTGLHHDYHKYTDDFEFIDFEKLVKVSRAGFLAGYLVANDPNRPVIDNPSK
ncbi:MAG: M20/M25/M40 family metallo-hydrolase, partial [Bacteroidales bacterium]|nr:M20/M25/M40 family metallo-hydrolase [Bacteroidales bacterium]